MSLEIDGVWKAGVWATTVWADGVWREGEAPAPTGQVDAPRGGKGDNDGRRRILRARGRTFKPTGLVDRPNKPKAPADRLEERIADAREIAAEVVADAAREFTADAASPIEIMSLAEVEREIGMLLRKAIRTEEEEVILLTLLAAVAVL